MAMERSDEFTEVAHRAYVDGVKLRFFMRGLGELKNEADDGITLNEFLKAQIELVNALVAAGKSPREIEKFLELFGRHALFAIRDKTPSVVASGGGASMTKTATKEARKKPSVGKSLGSWEVGKRASQAAGRGPGP